MNRLIKNNNIPKIFRNYLLDEDSQSKFTKYIIEKSVSYELDKKILKLNNLFLEKIYLNGFNSQNEMEKIYGPNYRNQPSLLDEEIRRREHEDAEIEAKRKKQDEKRRLAMQEAEEEDEDRLAAKDEAINERTFYQKNREMLFKSVDDSKLTPEQRVWWKDARNIEEQMFAWKKSAKMENQALETANKIEAQRIAWKLS